VMVLGAPVNLTNKLEIEADAALLAERMLASQ